MWSREDLSLSLRLMNGINNEWDLPSWSTELGTYLVGEEAEGYLSAVFS